MSHIQSTTTLKENAYDSIRGWAKRENESSGYFNKFLNPFWFLNTPGAKLSLFCKHSFIDESYLLLFSWQVSFQNILYNLK